MSNEDVSSDHFITVRSVQIYRGGFDASFLNEDSSLADNALDLDFQREKSLSFKCDCGERFNKLETVTGHLRDVSEGSA